MRPEGKEAARRGRPVLEYVINSSGAREGWIKVGVRWPDDSTTTGSAVAGDRRDSRARAAASALAKALEPVLETHGARVELADVLIHGPGDRDCVVIRGLYNSSKRVYDVSGTALIKDDVATAAARAALDALNRPLTRLGA
jgi:hypothetical protein